MDRADLAGGPPANRFPIGWYVAQGFLSAEALAKAVSPADSTAPGLRHCFGNTQYVASGFSRTSRRLLEYGNENRRTKCLPQDVHDRGRDRSGRPSRAQ